MHNAGRSIIIILFLFAGAALVASCENPGAAGHDPDIFVCGFYVNGNGDERACYWVNGSRTDLSSPNNNANSRANHMFISGTDMYFAGFYTSSMAGEGTIPCFWKNYTCTQLGVIKGRATGIFVDGTDVYVAGYHEDVSGKRACCWKNGAAERYDLPGAGSTRLDSGLSVWVDTSTVYVGGNYYNSGSTAYIPCRWVSPKTTISFSRTDYSPTGGSINDLLISTGSDIIACGHATTSTAYFWQNTFSYILPYSGPTSYAMAYAVTMDGAAVYSGGYYRNSSYNMPCYWYNNSTAVPLDNPVGHDAMVLDIQYCSANSTLYSAGYYTDGSGDTVPCYWTGTTKHDLTGYQGWATGIVVIP